MRAGELAFWLEVLSQLVETAPWNLTSVGTRPLAIRAVGVSALAYSRSLVVLSLTGSAVTDEGVNALRRLTALVCLDLSGSSKLSAASIRSLSSKSSAVRRETPQKASAAVPKGLSQLMCVLMLDMEHAACAAVAESGEQRPNVAQSGYQRRPLSRVRDLR